MPFSSSGSARALAAEATVTPKPDPGASGDCRIAILAWGSLLWDLDDLAPHVAGAWRLRGGPRLPMEFSRVSAKRLRGLTVCLDPAAGVPCTTHAIASRRLDLHAARDDLARRERAPVSRIGWALANGVGESRLPAVVDAVVAWCRAGGWEGAAWTDLEPNFVEATGTHFTVTAGQEYLRALRGDSLAEAFRYIRKAPPSTRTPLRRALAADPWWRSLRAHSVSGR